MKILIGSLLFATAIFINFPELNSSPQPSSRAGSSRRNRNLPNSQRRSRIPERTYIEILGKQIEVDVAKIDNQYVAVECRVILHTLEIPNIITRTSINFKTQAAFKPYDGSLIKVVVYIEEDDQQRRRLLGAKVPPTEGERYAPGDPEGLNPDKSKWFITHDGIDYVVEVNPELKIFTDVKLHGRLNRRPRNQYILDHWNDFTSIHFGGVYFLVFTDPHNVIIGAALDRLWMYREGEPLEHENPYRNPQINPQFDHSTQLNPWAYQDLYPYETIHQHEVLDQPGIFGQYYNAYQQPNLRSNPQYAQQGGAYPPPNFDPSRDRPQHGGYQTPRIHFNPNRNYPPHHPPSR